MSQVKAAIDNDHRIELHDVTENVDPFYARADILLFTSLNEVTPLVLSEAMSHRIPIISTNIAGIPEMVTPTPAVAVAVTLTLALTLTLTLLGETRTRRTSLLTRRRGCMHSAHAAAGDRC